MKCLFLLLSYTVRKSLFYTGNSTFFYTLEFESTCSNKNCFEEQFIVDFPNVFWFVLFKIIDQMITLYLVLPSTRYR